MKHKIFIVMLACPLAVFGDEAQSTYGPFFRPVALSQRKDFNSNRPSQADTAYTVDSGVVQFETGAVIYTAYRDTPDASRSDMITVGQTNVRVGVTENFEFQTIVSPYAWAQHTDAAGLVTRDSGFGDTVLRGFWSLAGNDGKGIGLAVLPYVKLPSNGSTRGLIGNRKLEGGLEVPLAYAFDEKTSLASSPGIALDWNSNNRYDADPYGSLALFRSISSSVSVFVEGYAKKYTGSGGDNSVVAQVDIGLVWTVTKDFSLDWAAYRGLTKASPEWVLQSGFALRF